MVCHAAWPAIEPVSGVPSSFIQAMAPSRSVLRDRVRVVGFSRVGSGNDQLVAVDAAAVLGGSGTSPGGADRPRRGVLASHDGFQLDDVVPIVPEVVGPIGSGSISRGRRSGADAVVMAVVSARPDRRPPSSRPHVAGAAHPGVQRS